MKGVAKNRPLKIVVVGAGPAGLACSFQLAKQAHDVTVFESSPLHAKQGSGVLLQPIGMSALKLMGLADEVAQLGRPIEAIRGRESIKNKVIVDIDYRTLNGTHATGIDRTKLWQLLHHHNSLSGVKIINDVAISQVEYTHENKLILTDTLSAKHGEFDLVIDASGAHSMLLNEACKPMQSVVQDYGSLWTKLPMPEGALQDRNEMTLYSTKHNQGIGILPTGVDAFTGQNMATLFFNLNWKHWEPEKFNQWKQKQIEHWPNIEALLKPLVKHEQLYLAKFKQHTMSKPFGHRLAFIGDSAHASNPQLGQGINMSLVDAVVLPWALQECRDRGVQKALMLYAKTRRNHVRVYQTLARLLTPFYQSNNSRAIFFRDALYPLLIKLPLMKEFSAYLISGQLTKPLKNIK